MDCNDTLTFFKELKRMCDENGSCERCIFDKCWKTDLSLDELNDNIIKKAIKKINKWSYGCAPIKTRQSEILKMFPYIPKSSNQIIDLCPESMDTRFKCPIKRNYAAANCADCREKYWLKGKIE